MMRKPIPFCTAALMMLAACGDDSKKPPEPAYAETSELKIFNWQSYLAPETLTDFEKRYNVRVRYNHFNTDNELDEAIGSNELDYDLIAPSNNLILNHIRTDTYRKIDKSLIPNYKYINPQILSFIAKADPNNEHVVPFFWGVTTFAINTEQVKKTLGTQYLPFKQWDMVFNPKYTEKLKSCGIVYLDNPTDMFPLALNYLGKNPNSRHNKDLQEATDLMKRNRPHVQDFLAQTAADTLAEGKACIVVGYAGDLHMVQKRAQKNGVGELKVMMPAEGVGIWVDSFAIPANAQNVLNAHRYINYALEPEIAAKNGNFAATAPTSMPAKELMSKEYQNLRTIFPNDEDLYNSFIMAPVTPQKFIYITEKWQEIKDSPPQ
ncbi:TPA: extracellular solute-binding protein [Neisseria weaveri]